MQSLVAAFQKQETRSNDVAVLTDAEYKAAKHKREQSRKSAKKACLLSSAS